MRRVDVRDLIGGSALMLMGIAAAIHGATSLPLGSMSQLGPGMFPTALGVLLALAGAGVAILALFRSGGLPPVDLRAFGVVMVSILVFALTIEPFGLVPSTVILTFIASRADSKLSWLATGVLAAALAVAMVLLLPIGLKMPIEIFAWPW